MNPLHRRTVLKQGYVEYIDHINAPEEQWAIFKIKAPIAIKLALTLGDISLSVSGEALPRHTTPEVYIPFWMTEAPEERSEAFLQDAEKVDACKHLYASAAATAIRTYYSLVDDKGISPAQAQMILPQGVYVEWLWEGSPQAYADMYNKWSAQWEVQYCLRI